MLTEDTCVTEPVDTARRERAVRARQGAGGGSAQEGWAPAIGPKPRRSPNAGWVGRAETAGAC